MRIKLLQLCLIFCNPIDFCLLGSSAHGILQARTLEWVAMPFSRGSSQPRGQTRVYYISGRFISVVVLKKRTVLPSGKYSSLSGDALVGQVGAALFFWPLVGRGQGFCPLYSSAQSSLPPPALPNPDISNAEAERPQRFHRMDVTKHCLSILLLCFWLLHAACRILAPRGLNLGPSSENSEP